MSPTPPPPVCPVRRAPPSPVPTSPPSGGLMYIYRKEGLGGIPGALPLSEPRGSCAARGGLGRPDPLNFATGVSCNLNLGLWASRKEFCPVPDTDEGVSGG
ncbi:PREDICTED: uncharacterized protein LOC109486751 [Branchiostoma belcheri]|uniref:Uncharacterized protein LOC109486751 n=1 Tax=Branchiostoma belcheri TaxID=7741 RepID=A0A6P5AW66_BRABE|nr:PREDICTED: uncharacterized protein LOC109486751 [Branchiostoma belcheri]